MSVTWVLNGNSKYEISSKEHLLQLMAQGSLYTDAGTPPSDYWKDDYEQTIDIDLEADANISPIGIGGDVFQGAYDGGGFSISNWSMVSTQNYVGLFGYADRITLENIRLTGVWTISGAGYVFGFLVGTAYSAIIRNIECDFDEGTSITMPHTSYKGGVVGDTFYGNLYDVTLRGFVNHDISTMGRAGCMVGRARASTIRGIRNASAWSNGITGTMVGGIVGDLAFDSVLTHAINSMVGDVTGTTCGGMCGYNQRGGGTDAFNTLVNSMRGNITGTTHAGGIVGHTHCESGNLDLFDVTNYMTGAIVSTNGTSGGIIGLVTRVSSYTCTVSNSVVAMNGSSDEAVLGTIDFTPAVSTKIDTSFGFTYTATTYGSTTDVFTGTTSTLYPGLDYIPLVFTDDVSNSYEYEMVFGNVGGSGSPADTKPLVHLDVTGTRAIDITVEITPISEAEAYQIRYAPTSGGTVTIAHSGFTELSKRVTGLSPGVEYEVFLYFLPVGVSVYTLDGSRTVTTLDNTAANYDLSVYGTGGKYDLSGVRNMKNMTAVMNDLFASGDKLSINVGRNKKTTTFVKLGESVSIPDEAAFLPFTPGSLSGQEVTLTLSDNTSQVISYNEVTGEISVGGSTYADGDAFVLDGQKTQVLSI